jgi:hypothetical protein
VANEQNLKKILSTSEARELGSKGGKSSVKKRKEKKMLRECLEILLDKKIETDDGKMTGAEAMAVKAFQLALAGDLKAWELVRDTAGQKPIDKVVMSEVDPDILNEVEKMVTDCEDDA